MAKSARRGPKGKASVTASATSSGTSTPSSQNGPIPPFVRAPESLEPLLKSLSPREVYLIHVDTCPVDIKKQIFIVPCAINAIVVVLLALRIYMVRNMYPAMIAALIGMNNSMTVDTSTMDWTEVFRFLFGAVRWRRNIGFRPHEIIVRRSQPDMTQGLKRDRWIREDKETRDRIVAAVTPERIRKTGYLLIDQDFDLDYDAMIKAHEMVDNRESDDKVSLDEFRTAVLVNTDAHGWLIWHVGDQNEKFSPDTSDIPADPARSAQRDQILVFKEKLTAMGKEDLFYRWVELVQYESTQPGGFTPERQQSAMLQVKHLFEENDVDFSKFWEDVGGLEEFTEQLD
ncbi:hypothetical protein BDQ94DRAFT_84286 [Aspergillus welwitschiae]|uniref:Uncharacterized protein n=1 Tax=Aspergillus welwitschiae TaxID=1341132 RepID=A0A3F3PRR0_9EURO|nr:hypothetical protein BDQ94DRAFT_84286 [Aspergillus welwitschiae]RDH29543.1 hypothetical protein BDQ94DRAFT_84286 [Aspergillus welwitschiae]